MQNAAPHWRGRAKFRNNMNIKPLLAALSAAALISCSALKDGDYNLTIVTTGDGHGNWFSRPLAEKQAVRGTIMAQSRFVNGIREEKGEDNVILIDAGDNLLGNDAAFYYGYVDTLSPHLFPRLAGYMRYDAVVAGHSDFEAGHGIYDRVAADFRKERIPFLAGNAFSRKSGKPYFGTCSILKKKGVRVAVLGYTNADNAALMDSSAFSGIEFRSLIPLVQKDVDRVMKKEKPHVVAVVAHTGTGKGDGKNLEKQGLDLFHSLRGVDFVIAAHDHAGKAISSDSSVFIDAGRGAQSAGTGEIRLHVKDGRVIGRELSANVVNLQKDDIDKSMESAFADEYDKVSAFVSSRIGRIDKAMLSREFYWGQCDYMNFLHTLTLTWKPVDISLGATLLIDGRIESGDVRFCDIRKIYPYENKLVILNMTGKEIKAYLEASYDGWISTVADSGAEHVLRIKETRDWGTGNMVWKLAKSPANFDSAAGINYIVDVTKPYGSRVSILNMADGSAFDMDRMYSVGITTYRAVGSGGLLKASGLDSAEAVEKRITCRGPEFRTILYEYLKRNGSIDPEKTGDPKVVGRWKFVPIFAEETIKKDIELIYGK